MVLKIIKKNQYETEDEDWAFSDGVAAGVIGVCKRYNIDVNDVYKKDAISEKDINCEVEE